MEQQLLLEIIKNPSNHGFAVVLLYLIFKSISDWRAKISSNKKILEKIKDLYSKVAIIDIRTEHSSFISSFASEIETHKELILTNYQFKDSSTKYIANEIIERVIDIFIGIMERGYSNYDQVTLEQNFKLYEVKLQSIINVADIKINTDKVFQIIQIEKESFFIDIIPILPLKNGERQAAYKKLCKRTIKLITKKMSAL